MVVPRARPAKTAGESTRERSQHCRFGGTPWKLGKQERRDEWRQERNHEWQQGDPGGRHARDKINGSDIMSGSRMTREDAIHAKKNEV